MERQELIAFRVGEINVGIPIERVQEINRQLDIFPVPQAPREVRGVINLRGDVVTILDLRQILAMPPAEIGPRTRVAVVDSTNERVGLLVDAVTDVVQVTPESAAAPPANLPHADARLFTGVGRLDEGLVWVLDVDAALDLQEEAVA